MTADSPRASNRHRVSGYWVEAPRTTDPIGFVLRDAYTRDQGIPEDMAALLRQITDRPDAR